MEDTGGSFALKVGAALWVLLFVGASLMTGPGARQTTDSYVLHRSLTDAAIREFAPYYPDAKFEPPIVTVQRWEEDYHRRMIKTGRCEPATKLEDCAPAGYIISPWGSGHGALLLVNQQCFVANREWWRCSCRENKRQPHLPNGTTVCMPD